MVWKMVEKRAAWKAAWSGKMKAGWRAEQMAEH
jgi:hypothetical protein